ncbi:MAG: RusA family crossover junction endodeoxyribonuclease [Planctomycetota bacterium]|jgi:Holliday junction resolvase RusA-like endonuclease
MIWIPLKAVAKQRARLTRPRRGRKSRAYTPQRTVHFENSVAAAYQAAGGTHWGDIPVGMELEIHKDGISVDVFPLESSVRPVGIRGDIDNIVKAVQDGLNGVAWADDRQVELLVVSFVGVPRKGSLYDERENVAVPDMRSGDVDIGNEVSTNMPALADEEGSVQSGTDENGGQR